ncbi:MAG: phosphate signaling complex protein PhoU [Dehalococcoidia bacterium]
MTGPRVSFDRSLDALQQEILMLGSMVEKAIAKSVDALKRRDLSASQEVVREDDDIDRKRYELEETVIDLIASQQPVAKDLRTLVAALHIAVELERIGDYAEGIGKISLLMGDAPPIKPLVDIPRMAEKAQDMLHRSMDALVNRDVELAKVVCADDDEVDALYDQVYRELVFLMVQDPKNIERATFLLWASHDLERIGDRATNIAERVIYMVTGKMAKDTRGGRY